MNAELLQAAATLSPELTALRRKMHAHPELSGQEEWTGGFIATELRKLGLTPQERINGTFGVIATLECGGGLPAVALRADFDALPIVEETGVEYASTRPGVMHACGHDAHVAMLLGAAKLLLNNRDRLRRPVRFIFQPHEESYPGGAPDMIAGGALKGVSEMFGIHISSMLSTGQIGTRVGPFMAAVNTLNIRIVGRGGHAAMPNQCIDPIVVGSAIVTALQSIVSRNVTPSDPAVVSVTQFHAGTTHNVIPNEAALNGTIRTFDEGVRKMILERVRDTAEYVARGFGAQALVDLGPGYPVLNNDKQTTDHALAAARRIGFTDAQLQTLAQQGGAEDFSYYGQHVPATFVFLGAANDAKQCTYPHHHPRFNVDEDALVHGAALHAQFALDASDRGGD